MLDAAGYDVNDPTVRGLVALVNLGCRPPGINPDKMPSPKIYKALMARLARHFTKIRKLVIEAKMAGVDDSHITTVPLPPEKQGVRPHGELQYYPEHGWRYVPAEKTYLAIRATHRLAVISCLQSAIWQADRRRRNRKGNGLNRRAPIIQK